MYRLMSASSWGCELKWRLHKILCGFLCVSLFVRLWVEISAGTSSTSAGSVSLFVRLWVEIQIHVQGCRITKVSLFVRLWVEMITGILQQKEIWGQPLREAVSWNSCSAGPGTWWKPSASSWGCELKYDPQDIGKDDVGSASSWGCELK